MPAKAESRTAERPATDPFPTGDPLEDLAAVLTRWSDRPRSPVELARAARPLAARIADETPGVAAAVRTGDLAAAQAAALDAVAAERDPARREARRTGCAWALSQIEAGGAEPLFAADRDAGRLRAASDLLHVALLRGWRPWEVALAENLFGHPDRPIRLAAIGAQIMAARTGGLPTRSMRRLITTAIGEPRAGRFGRDLAELIWTNRLGAFVQPLFGRFGPLVNQAQDDPLLAWLLRERAWHRAPGANRGSIRAGAQRLERVEDATDRFWRRLADPGLSLSVVGNSPCEQGRGRGPEIDGRQMVVRFNDSPEDGRFADDYGARCDVKVLAVRNTRRPDMRTSARHVVFRRQRHVVSSRMALPERFQRDGAEVVYVPSGLAQALRVRLGSTASTGLAFLAQVRAVRGSLTNVSCFGFSMTDQIEPGARSHYFNRSVASERHAWLAERALFNAWTSGR